MINIETVKFIDLLNEMAEQTAIGFVPFSEYTEQHSQCIVYDDDVEFSDGENLYHRIVNDWDANEIRHAGADEYDMHVVESKEDNRTFVAVTFKKSDDWIIIEEGVWYCI